MPLRPIAYFSNLERYAHSRDDDGSAHASDLEFSATIEVTDNNHGTGGEGPMRFVGKLAMTSYGATVDEARDRMIAGLEAAIADLRAA